MKNNKISKFSLFILFYNLLVILFGAFVRATGSGAGCGAHWPLCNGVIIPRSIQIETVIEFTHRITSGLSLVFVIVLYLTTLKAFPKGNKIRTAAFLSLLFTISEALVGAGLVLFELVAKNTSIIRVYSIAVHLVNTNLLLASITIVFILSKFGVPKQKNLTQPWVKIFSSLILFMMLVLGASGAVTALGDTLFPAETLLEGIQMDLSSDAHFLIRLRIIHPIIAIGTGLGLGVFLALTNKLVKTNFGQKIKTTLTTVYLLQLIFGGLNVVLLAPIWMQIIHLLIADLVWILFIIYLIELFFMVSEDVSCLQTEPLNP